MRLKLKTKFTIPYPEKNYKYYSSTQPKKRLTNLLISSCDKYCMYCGKSIVLEGDYRCQIEHSVDRDGNVHQEVDIFEVLKHCKYNMAISCNECNQVCKKAVDKIDLSKYAPINECPKECKKPCDKYNDIRKEYSRKNAIILQPLGREDIGERAISYNLLKHIYEPSDEGYKDDIIFLIQNHIDRFLLNGSRFSPAVIDICAYIVDFIDGGINDIDRIISLLEYKRQDNVLGVEFINFIRCNFVESSIDKLASFCKLLVVLDAVI